MPHDVFISYTNRDSDSANQVCQAIEKRGVKCWISPRDIDGGVFYPAAIIKAIKRSKMLVVVISSASMSSDHVISEVHAAFKSHLPIVALRIEDVKPSENIEYLLGPRNWVDAHQGKFSDHIETLAAEIETHIAKDDPLPKLNGIVQKPFTHGVHTVKEAVPNIKNWITYIAALIISVLTMTTLRNDLRGIMSANALVPMLIVLMPLLVILPGIFSNYKKRLRKRYMRKEGEIENLKDPEYFRIYPYTNIPEYMKEFRADKIHIRVLEWVQESTKPILFLSGQSGTGKTSIINAYLCPELESQTPQINTIISRSVGDPVMNIQRELFALDLVDVRSLLPDADIRSLFSQAVKATESGRLVVVLDQFEELLIINENDPDRVQNLKKMLTSLTDQPVPGLTILLVFRSDYLPFLESFKLPALHDRQNWFEVGAFTENYARAFLKGSNVPFSDEALNQLFEQIASFEGTRGLVRPIILNLIGLIVSKSSELYDSIKEKATENLLAEYLRHHVFRRNMQDHGPKIIGHMITKVGTKMAQSVSDLAILTGIPQAEVKGALNILANTGLVRQIDAFDDIWEISHDFVAYHLHSILKGRYRSILTEFSNRFAPATLILWTIVVFILIPPYMDTYQKSKLFETVNAAGGVATVAENQIKGITLTDVTNTELMNETLNHLLGIDTIEHLVIAHCNITDEQIRILSGLTQLKHLDLRDNPITDDGLAYLRDLPSLQFLDISLTKITDKGLENLAGLKSLEHLSLNYNDLNGEGLQHLTGLKSLRRLEFNRNRLDTGGLKNIGKMTSLTHLSLHQNRIKDEDLKNLSDLKSLTNLHLYKNDIHGEGLSYLSKIPNLKNLNLIKNRITGDGLAFLSELKSIKVLQLANNQISGEGLKHLSKLPSLEDINLTWNQITDQDLEYIGNLKSLKSLNLSGNHFGNDGLHYLENLTSLETLQMRMNEIDDDGLACLQKLKSLNYLDLGVNLITGDGLTYLSEMPSLRSLHLFRNQIKDKGLLHLKNLDSLATLDLWGNGITDDGLEILSDYRSLKVLDVSSNLVTTDGLMNLRRNNPDLAIVVAILDNIE